MDIIPLMSETFAVTTPSHTGARRALLDSFARLATRRRYGEISVEGIIRAARVGRSTFYYHFSGKDDLLLENLEPFILALAAAPHERAVSDDLRHWIEHIWEHRSLSMRVLSGRTGAKLQRRLVQALVERLEDELPIRSTSKPAILAEQLAGGIMDTLRAWLNHRFSAEPSDIADAIWRFANSAVSA